MAQIGIDFSQVPQYEGGGGDPVPAGWYNVAISNSEAKPTKDNQTTGHWFVWLEFTILDGQFKGRKVFTQLNIGHSNPTTKEIAFKQMSSIAHSVGVIQVQDSVQLHNLPLKIRVKLRAGAQQKDPMGNVIGQYEASNDVADYKPVNYEPASPLAAPNMTAPGTGTGFPQQQGAPAFNTTSAASFPSPAQQTPAGFAPANVAPAVAAFNTQQPQFNQPANTAMVPGGFTATQNSAPATAPQFQQQPQPQFQQPNTAQFAATSAAPAGQAQTAPAFPGQQQQQQQAPTQQAAPNGAPVPPWIKQ